MATEKTQCRRRFERVERSVITYYRKADADEIERAGLAQNISFGGLYVELGEVYAPDDVLELEMTLEDGAPPIQVRARVVRSDTAGSALEFLEISDGDRAHLQAYLQERYRRNG